MRIINCLLHLRITPLQRRVGILQQPHGLRLAVEVPLDLVVPPLRLLELRFEAVVFGEGWIAIRSAVVAGTCMVSSDGVPCVGPSKILL
jgi:hypothetical protein